MSILWDVKQPTSSVCLSGRTWFLCETWNHCSTWK